MEVTDPVARLVEEIEDGATRGPLSLQGLLEELEQDQGAILPQHLLSSTEHRELAAFDIHLEEIDAWPRASRRQIVYAPQGHGVIADPDDGFVRECSERALAFVGAFGDVQAGLTPGITEGKGVGFDVSNSIHLKVLPQALEVPWAGLERGHAAMRGHTLGREQRIESQIRPRVEEVHSGPQESIEHHEFIRVEQTRNEEASTEVRPQIDGQEKIVVPPDGQGSGERMFPRHEPDLLAQLVGEIPSLSAFSEAPSGAPADGLATSEQLCGSQNPGLR